MPATTTYALIMLAAGIGIPVLAALNAALGQYIASPLAAGVVVFVVGLVISGAVVLATGEASHLAKLPLAPKHLLLAGAFMAFYAITITFVAPKFGVGNAVFFVLLGQLISAAAIDHFGLFGAQLSPISLTRAAGIGVMAVGVWLTQMA
ncbi:DMT family transporter [Cognatishimia sp. SS12]|uniref:DMT family transporter n=1 Tax=Cognatishimia sp. SS12 TaxID=2979465 RepID=UPI00232AE638|nr:DMT family transporter [Cognatishimia sp. SS12]MDC0738566.1 DMT family transporter [Cognatishimia sp. SS12]